MICPAPLPPVEISSPDATLPLSDVALAGLAALLVAIADEIHGRTADTPAAAVDREVQQ